METVELSAYLEKYRLVDLTKKVSPGKATGPVDTGARKYNIKPFVYPPGEIMHSIEMESHISTHVESPAHYITARYGIAAMDVSEIPLQRFFGTAIVVDCKDLAPQTPIDKGLLSGIDIRKGDIVLIGKCQHTGKNRCFMDKAGVEYLVSRSIKMIGFDDTVWPENLHIQVPKPSLENYFMHDLMLGNGIPIIEGLAHLDQLTKSRVLFFGFPAAMGGLDSFPIRAVAFEPLEGTQ